MVVWKYQLKMGLDTIVVPPGATFLHFGLDPRSVRCVWLEVDPRREPSEVKGFRIVGTGEEHDFMGEYRGTLHESGFIWHLYEVPPGMF